MFAAQTTSARARALWRIEKEDLLKDRECGGSVQLCSHRPLLQGPCQAPPPRTRT